jgi:hypothetical protein
MGVFSDKQSWWLDDYAQIDGGTEGFLDWWFADKKPFDRVIVEKFTPLVNKGFSHTEGSIEAKKVEGAIEAVLYPAQKPIYQRPAQQYWVPGKNATEKRRKQKLWVKENHPKLYKTGKDVGQKDAEDYWSALFHSLTYMRNLRHAPTLKHYWPEG